MCGSPFLNWKPNLSARTRIATVRDRYKSLIPIRHVASTDSSSTKPCVKGLRSSDRLTGSNSQQVWRSRSANLRRAALSDLAVLSLSAAPSFYLWLFI